MDDSTAIKLLVSIFIFSAFFSLGITAFTHYLPADAKYFASGFSGSTIDLETTTADLEENLQRQTNIPVIDVGALVFYSGNIFLDFMLNFIFAIPEAIGLIFKGLSMLFSFDAYIVYIVESFFGAIIILMYFMSILLFITGFRSGRVLG